MKKNGMNLGAALRLAALLLVVGLLAACTTTGGGKGASGSSKLPPEEQAQERATRRWELLIEKRYEEAYRFLSPGYRKVRSEEEYVKVMRGRPVQWTRVMPRSATCETELCTVDVEVHAQIELPVMRVGTVNTLTVLTENWILSNGEWYLVPDADR